MSALRLTARPFGHNAGPRQRFVPDEENERELVAVPDPWPSAEGQGSDGSVAGPAGPAIRKGDRLVIEVGDRSKVHVVGRVETEFRQDYNLSGQTTESPWRTNGLTAWKRTSPGASPPEDRRHPRRPRGASPGRRADPGERPYQGDS